MSETRELANLEPDIIIILMLEFLGTKEDLLGWKFNSCCYDGVEGCASGLAATDQICRATDSRYVCC